MSPSLPSIDYDPRNVSVPIPSGIGERVEERWTAVLLLAAVVAQSVGVWRIVSRLSPGTRPGLRDSIIFEYYGLRLADGARIYVDLWEIKPPLAFELPAALALLSGGDVYAYHWLAVLATNAAAVGSVLVVGALVHEMTEDGLAALVGGLALFAHPAFAWRAPIGFKAKYFVVLFGLLGILLALRRRPALAGVAAGATLGFWQFGLVFPLIGLGATGHRTDRRGMARFAAGVVAIWALVLAPVALWGALDAMVAETVLTPLLVSSQRPMADRIGNAVAVLGPSIPVVLLGLYGALVPATRRFREVAWWVPVGLAWFGLAIVLFDFDWAPDLLPAFAFVALGIGLVVGEDRHPAIVWLVVAMAVLSVASLALGTTGPFGGLSFPHAHEVPAEMQLSAPYSDAERRFLFWRNRAPETCRVFAGVTQTELVTAIEGGSLEQATCGHPGPIWDALVGKYPFLGALSD